MKIANVIAALLLLVAANRASAVDEFKDGSWYKISSLDVIQVIDETTMIAEIDKERVWIDDVSTKGLVDGKRYPFPKLYLKVVGTKTYKTALGGTKTVHRLRGETDAERKEREDGEKAEARERAEGYERLKESRAKAKKEKEAKEAEKNAKTKREQEAGAASRKLKLARTTLAEAEKAEDTKEASRLRKLAYKYLEEIIKEYPKSAEAGKAKELLKGK